MKERIERAYYSATLINICCAKWSGKARIHSVGVDSFFIEGYHTPIEIKYTDVWFAA